MAEEIEQEELTPEQLTELKTKAAKAEELEKINAEKDTKIKKFETDEGLINWRKSRKQIKAMDEALNKKGLKLDEDTDEVKSLEKEFSPEDIDKRAEAAAERVLINKSLAKAQKDLSDTDKEVFKKYYEKASHGEVVTSDNVEEIIDQAWRMSGTNTKTTGDRAAGARGGAPRTEKKEESYADSAEGQAAYDKMFKFDAKRK